MRDGNASLRAQINEDDTGNQLTYEYRPRKRGLSILLNFLEVSSKRCQKNTHTRITGLWQPSVHSDVAF
uniref:Bm13153, isoform c n=1 Tax=Brugia malayi TaxID=6279 RepID=A0A0K0IX08_BRUMA|nr:Bm13153, isoform c [Brugia malayi]